MLTLDKKNKVISREKLNFIRVWAELDRVTPKDTIKLLDYIDFLEKERVRLRRSIL